MAPLKSYMFPFPNTNSIDLLPTSSSKPNCAVCESTRTISAKFGAPACAGCSVFFKRAILKNSCYKCWKTGCCEITDRTRTTCQLCRLEKSFKVGMKASAIKQRDVLGPRSLRNLHGKFHETHRRANACDLKSALKLALSRAADFGKQFHPFRRLSIDSTKCVLAEFALSYSLIDQGFKTAREAEDGFWLLSNGSFLHFDYFLGLEKTKREDVEEQAELHETFVTDLLDTVARPMRELQIDGKECEVLKTLLLFTPSFSQRNIYSSSTQNTNLIIKNCMEELMEHCEYKSPCNNGFERFGEILLFISSIRCGVKALYNQMKISELFDLIELDPYIQDVLLT